MIPFANTSITLYHKQQYKNENGKTVTAWERSVFHGCRIFTQRTVGDVGGVSIITANDIVQISGKVNITADDIIVKGVCEAEIPKNGVAMQLLSSLRVVKSVSDNTDGPLPHTAITLR